MAATDAPAQTGAAPTFRSGPLAELLGAELRGSPDVTLNGLATLEHAGPTCLSFVRDAKYLVKWMDSDCGAALVTRSVIEGSTDLRVTELGDRAMLIVDDADLALITMLQAIAVKIDRPEGVHESAVIDPSAKIGAGVRIGAQVSIGPDCELGDGVVLHAGVRLGSGVRLGESTELRPNVVVMDGCFIGRGCLLHPGVVIGADGFGFRPKPDGTGLIKIPHAGHVEIGDDVEIGANSCIDRGKFGPTIIGSGCKLDNHVQIAHNVVVGECSIICGQTGIAGSVTIGKGVTIAGHCGIADQLTIGDGAIIAAKAGLMSNVGPGETWFGYPARPASKAMRNFAALDRLGELMPQIRRLLRGETGGR